MLSSHSFFDLADNPFAGIFAGTEYVWEGLTKIKQYLLETLQPNAAAIRRGETAVMQTAVLHEGKIYFGGFTIDRSGKKPVVSMEGEVLPRASIIYAGSYLMDDLISIGKGSVVEPGAMISGPAVIGDHCEVRQGAYIRGDVLIGSGCVIGHTTEIKSSVMLGGSKAGHFAYIGDSILGRVNLGAGTKLANLKMIPSSVTITVDGEKYDTGLRKFGAILGDGVETGCNSVTTPGSLLGKNTLLYPNTTARGYYPPDTFIKCRQNIKKGSLR